ncbi:D-alanyl-D-alanine carboxypeptidase [Streptomyces sp. AJS327]|uniref:D-alanyl-D-alanine carboxypeptidase family protein n=1 Tax=Streptomyces sp. AJS327 TaxID=2545265 RepID=UPI0027E55B2D|nr:D-alanyl-D-alanine carboxypeptidase [Streptomyces sp. AJS327]
MPRRPLGSAADSVTLRPAEASRRRARRARVLAALTSGSLLLPVLLLPGSARADGPGADDKPEKQARPPSTMSTVGGARLGKPGTQVSLRTGAPALPRGVTARSWIVSDAETGEVLASHNAHWKLPPASTLKMLFADTVLPKLPKDQKHKVAPADLAGMGTGSSLVGVKEHQTYAVDDLWRGVFLRSGNDAVHVLSAMNGGKERTVRQMNARAKELRALDTHAVSPDGYDRPGQVSSAYDLSLIARSGMQNAEFRKYAATATADFPGEEREKKNGKKAKRETFEIQSTNRLLTGAPGMDPYPGIAGVKNGTTSKAGSTFTGVAQRGERVLLVTVMHPEKEGILPVFRETARLFDWGFSAAEKVRPVGRLVAPVTETKRRTEKDDGKESTAADQAADKPSGGAGTALGVTAGCLALLGLLAYGVHRRWPLPELTRLRKRPGEHGQHRQGQHRP